MPRTIFSTADIDALRAESPAKVATAEAAALLYLDARDSVLCALSAEEGEWPTVSTDGTPELGLSKRDITRMRVPLVELYEHCKSLAEDPTEMAWFLLTQQAIKYGYPTIINWSLYSECVIK